MMTVQFVGLTPFTVARQSFDTTGRAVAFREPNTHVHMRSAHVSLFVYTGSALVSLTGNAADPCIELPPLMAFDFPVATDSVYIKASSGTCEVAVVAAIAPIERGGP
jgi:hypothetical protein